MQLVSHNNNNLRQERKKETRRPLARLHTESQNTSLQWATRISANCLSHSFCQFDRDIGNFVVNIWCFKLRFKIHGDKEQSCMCLWSYLANYTNIGCIFQHICLCLGNQLSVRFSHLHSFYQLPSPFTFNAELQIECPFPVLLQQEPCVSSSHT